MSEVKLVQADFKTVEKESENKSIKNILVLRIFTNQTFQNSDKKPLDSRTEAQQVTNPFR